MNPAPPQDWPFVSVVVPCRNERGYVAACLDSILACEYPRDRLEIVIADGMSADGTRDILARYATAYPHIRLLDNPRGLTPCALNLALRAARGEVIVRMDAHAVYPPEYLCRLVRAQQETGADNVGTVVRTLPADATATAAAIATGLSDLLGVGNSHFRVGTKLPRWVNHVPFGCWRRELFDRIGMFDEELPRDQDVEFNARLLNRGGRILLLPDAAPLYHGRRTLRQLWLMMYQYGYFKPLVARKAGKVLTIRQLVPALFVLSLGAVALLAPVWSAARLGLWLLLAAYVLLIGGALARALPRLSPRAAVLLPAVFPTMHLGYGVGYLCGIWHHVLRRRPVRHVAPLALSR